MLVALWGATGYSTFAKELPSHLIWFLAGTKRGHPKTLQGRVHKALVF